MWMFHGFRVYGSVGRYCARIKHVGRAGAHFYDTYECADGEYVSIGSIEPQFYALLKERAGLTEEEFGDQNDQSQWPAMKEKLACGDQTKNTGAVVRDYGGDGCVFRPRAQLPGRPQTSGQYSSHAGTYIEVDGLVQPAPAPRFGRTPSEVRHSGHEVGQDTDVVLTEMGFSEQELTNLKANGSIV